MALRLEDKKTFVAEVNAVAEDSVTAVAAEYRGLTVAEMTELRSEARNAGVYLRVVKNTLAHRAVETMSSGVGPSEAAQQAIAALGSRTDGQGGIILIDPNGEVGFAFNTPCMAHAYLTEGMTEPVVGI